MTFNPRFLRRAAADTRRAAHPSLQLARAPGALSLAAHAVAATAATASGGGGGADLDAAIEARLPRYWAELLRICPNMTYRPYSCFPPHQRTSLAHSQARRGRQRRAAGRAPAMGLHPPTPACYLYHHRRRPPALSRCVLRRGQGRSSQGANGLPTPPRSWSRCHPSVAWGAGMCCAC